MFNDSNGVLLEKTDEDLSIELNSAIYPLKSFEIDQDRRNDRRPKMQQHGMWPTFQYREGMMIHLEGDILADDSEDYNLKRQGLIEVLNGLAPEAAPTTPVVHRLTLDFVGYDEAWSTPVIIDSVSIALTGASPAFSDFLITLYSFRAYFLGVDTATTYTYT